MLIPRLSAMYVYGYTVGVWIRELPAWDATESCRNGWEWEEKAKVPRWVLESMEKTTQKSSMQHLDTGEEIWSRQSREKEESDVMESVLRRE